MAVKSVAFRCLYILPTYVSKLEKYLKCETSDPGEPGNYRGMTITSAVYKAYCSILNSRLSGWAELNKRINGFRNNGSTIDHL